MAAKDFTLICNILTVLKYKANRFKSYLYNFKCFQGRNRGADVENGCVDIVGDGRDELGE